MVVVDTDVLVIEFAYQRDQRRQINSSFLDEIRSEGALVTLFNLMEFVGKMSFNFSRERLVRLPEWLRNAYNIDIIWPVSSTDPDAAIRELLYTRPFRRMTQHGMSYIDCLILDTAEETPGVEALVTWNARHFRGKGTLEAFTPEEYLRR